MWVSMSNEQFQALIIFQLGPYNMTYYDYDYGDNDSDKYNFNI